MGNVVNINGQLHPSDAPVLTMANRAFHYGDGVFETIRVAQGRGCFLDAHWARLMEGLRVLRIAMPSGLGREALEKAIAELAERNAMPQGRCRLTVYRDAPGLYRPEGNAGAFTLELHPMDHATYILNDRGFTVDIYPEMRKPVNLLSVHKTLGAQLFVMASLWCIDRHLDNCLLQNDRGNIIEGNTGNMFIVSNGVLYTPPLTDGCLAGIMRMQVINIALENGIKVYESSLNPQNLLVADELFFTNAALGVQWVATYRTKRYGHRMALRLQDLLVKKVSG
ncbi:MAG: aminotransferase class IV [Flavobacteriales bacterium]|nr:aminotransferase class IV [Flavobacteriales bacterium]MCL4283039.1 aminotransferase class IV [Flavobacteriales bacterium]